MSNESRNPDWKDGFLFLGNQLALDFLNTRPVQNGQPKELLPDFSALLRWFKAAGLLSSRKAANLYRQWGKSDGARRVVESVQVFREKLRKEVLAWEQGHAIRHSTLEELNRLMHEHPMRTRLRASGTGLSSGLYFETRRPPDLFAPLAYSASILFADVNRDRVRKCDKCVLHFYDTSKKGTRRWCTMQLCGNRQKVAAYAARRRRRRK